MITRSFTFKTALFALGLAASLPVLPDDTDIYINRNTQTASGPMVMFVLDYRSNLTSTICSNVNASCPQADYYRANALTAPDVPSSGKLLLFDHLTLALKIVLSNNALSSIRMGLMVSHQNNNSCDGPSNATNNAVSSTSAGCSNGAYVAMGFRPNNSDGRSRLFAIFSGMKQRQDFESNAQHPYQGKEIYFEFFRYLQGGEVHNGHNGYNDYSNVCNQPNSNNTATSFCDAANRNVTKNLNVTKFQVASSPAAAFIPGSQVMWDAAVETTTDTNCGGVDQRPCRARYVSPLTAAESCTKLFAINLAFGTTNSESDSDAAITAASGGMTGINLSGTSNSFNTVIQYMFDRDLSPRNADNSDIVSGVQNVTSYFMVPQPTNTQNSWARSGGTGRALELSEDPAELIEAFENLFTQVISVSTTFVSASVPVNVFNRATTLGSVYLALFQADSAARPFWPGNLKKLRLNSESDFVDVDGRAAISPVDGRINFDALTFWTDAAALTDSNATEQIIAGKDGRHITRGGAGQKIPGFLTGSMSTANGTAGGRTLYYDSAAGGATLAALNADSTTAADLQSALGAADATEAQNLLKFMRGIDPSNDTPRSWVMGDPLHSRPLPITYGTSDSSRVYIAVGTNDGFLHLFEDKDPEGNESGKEVWAFAPRKTMGIQKELLANPVPESTAPSHPYSVDGVPTGLQDSTGTYVFFGLRRGGDGYYALNVTNALSPTLAWRIDSGTTGFDELGLSFSTPRLARVQDASGTVVDALFFGAGYDDRKDYLTPNSADTKGRAIFAVNAKTGALIWKGTHAEMVDSIPSDVTVADTDGDGITDRLLVADSGGNVWRADFVGVPSNWKVTLLAKLGYHADSGATNDRRFFHAPDLVQSRDLTPSTDPNVPQEYDAVIIGSGDREDPLDQKSLPPFAQNFFYVIKDRRTQPSVALSDLGRTHGQLTDITTNTCLIRGTEESCGVDLSLGWKLQLNQGPGEKALSQPVTFGNTVFFTTYLPSGTSEEVTCGPKEGSGLQYAISLQTGAPTNNYNLSDDQQGDTSGLANTTDDRFSRLASGGIPGHDVFIPTADGLRYIRPDNTDERPPGSNRFSSFWQRVER